MRLQLHAGPVEAERHPLLQAAAGAHDRGGRGERGAGENATGGLGLGLGTDRRAGRVRSAGSAASGRTSSTSATPGPPRRSRRPGTPARRGRTPSSRGSNRERSSARAGAPIGPANWTGTEVDTPIWRAETSIEVETQARSFGTTASTSRIEEKDRPDVCTAVATEAAPAVLNRRPLPAVASSLHSR